jgi:urea transport system permease protein
VFTEFSMTTTALGEALSNSISLSSILVLTAIGLAITFGVMRVINMAHGEMLTLGAYTAFVVTDPQLLPAWINQLGAAFGYSWHVELNLFVAIPIAFLVVGFFGYLTEVFLIRYLYGRPLDTLLATWGLGLVVQQAVNLIFGANLKAVEQPVILQPERIVHLDVNVVAASTVGVMAPPFGQGALLVPLANTTEINLPNIVQIGGIAISYYRLFVFGIALLCLLGVYIWFYKTSSGLKIRAVVQNRSMASALGISTRRVDALTFAIATGLAGVAGCILGPLYNVNYTMGNQYIVDAFMVVILGGMGQLVGSIAGAAVIGTGTGFVEKLVSQPPMAKVIVLTTVVCFLLIRPAGLFAVKERSYE